MPSQKISAVLSILALGFGLNAHAGLMDSCAQDTDCWWQYHYRAVINPENAQFSISGSGHGFPNLHSPMAAHVSIVAEMDHASSKEFDLTTDENGERAQEALDQCQNVQRDAKYAGKMLVIRSNIAQDDKVFCQVSTYDRGARPESLIHYAQSATSPRKHVTSLLPVQDAGR